MRISDWSSDVCSSDLTPAGRDPEPVLHRDGDEGDILDAGGQMAVGRAGEYGSDHFSCAHAALPSSGREIGRASCRERVCQYVSILVVAVSLKKKTNTNITHTFVDTNLSINKNY